MRRTGRIKRNSKLFEKLRNKRLHRKTKRVQRGGNPGGNLLDNADGPDLTPVGNLDFNVRFQPTVKANEQGPKLTTYQTAHEPYPVWTPPTPPAKYTIMCWDPDVPEGKSFLHWLVVNCPGSDPSDGKVIASWHPPSPPPGSGPHRYIIGLLKQTNDLSIPEITNRLNFNPKNFASENGLVAIAYRGFRVETPALFVPEGTPQAAPPQAAPLPPPQPALPPLPPEPQTPA